MIIINFINLHFLSFINFFGIFPRVDSCFHLALMNS